MTERVGFIFECGRDGPDYQVCNHFLGRLNQQITLVPRFLDNAERLLNECGDVAASLLQIEKCDRIVVAWDLEPAWGGDACRHDDKERAIASLRGAKVQLSKVDLLCIEQELESWLMADRRALEKVIGRYKHPHVLGAMPDYKVPDSQIGRPKTELISLFQRELGRGGKYVDRKHAILLAKSIPDWTKIRRSESFRRFAEKAARVKLPK
jgi:hypothetical protein